MPANVERPILPHRLYRYRSLEGQGTGSNGIFEREMEAIKQHYLWCSDFTCMNDPMEGLYRASTRLQQDENYANLVQRVFDQGQNVGIASFTDSRDYELMWAHYGRSYSGVCIAYDTSELVEGLPDGASLVRVGYADRLPRISVGAKRPREVITAILSQKKGCWAYEREWRVLGPRGRVDVSRPCVTHVYLGASIDSSRRDDILERLKGAGIKVSEMRLRGYEHFWERVQA